MANEKVLSKTKKAVATAKVVLTDPKVISALLTLFSVAKSLIKKKK